MIFTHISGPWVEELDLIGQPGAAGPSSGTAPNADTGPRARELNPNSCWLTNQVELHAWASKIPLSDGFL